MNRIAKSPLPEVESRSWHRLGLEILATDHPLACNFLVLIGVSAGGMFSLIFGIGLVVTLYELAFSNLADEEGPMMPVLMAICFALALGMTRLSFKAMVWLSEIRDQPSNPTDPIDSELAKFPNLWDRDLDG